jgi:hypothetical protein
MNREQDAIELLLSGNALMDLRALVRNAPRELSLRAMLEFLESTHAYVARVEAFVRALEPTIAAQRPELAGRGACVDSPNLPARCDCGWILPAAFQVLQPGDPSPMFPNGALLLFACGGCGVWLQCNLSRRGGAKLPNAAGFGDMGLAQVDGAPSQNGVPASSPRSPRRN